MAHQTQGWPIAKALPTSLFLLAGAVQPAFADDASASRWIGPYIGVHAGYGQGSTDFATTCDVFCQDFGDFRLNGIAGGFLAGYNFAAAHNLILGVEADVSFSSIDGDAFFGGKNANSDIDTVGTIRGRVGWLLRPDFMLYATGGVAIADISTGFTVDFFVPQTFSWSDVEFGWTVGAGVEKLLSDSFSLRVEYLYYDFGNISNDFQFFGAPGSAHFDTEFHIVRAGLSYKFD